MAQPKENTVTSLEEVRSRQNPPQSYRLPTRMDITPGREIVKEVTSDGPEGGMKMIPVYLDSDPLEVDSVYYRESGKLECVSLGVFLRGARGIKFLIKE